MRLETEKAIAEYWESVYAAAYLICRDRMDAEDAAQDAFVRYYTQRKEFKSKEHIKAWLLKTVINRAKDMTRSFFRRNKIPLEEYISSREPEESTEEALTRAEERRQLTAAVMALPEKYRTVIHLFYYEDYSGAEIAEMLGLSEANVRKRLSRAREMLKENLKEDWNYD